MLMIALMKETTSMSVSPMLVISLMSSDIPRCSGGLGAENAGTILSYSKQSIDPINKVSPLKNFQI